MSFPLHLASTDLNETQAREHECELEYALDLLMPYPEMEELISLIREALTYKSEHGKTQWQSVQAFELQHPDEWNQNIVHSDIAIYARDLDRRFEPIFRLMRIVQEENGEDALEALDYRVHEHMHIIAHGIHQVLSLGNGNREMYQQDAVLIALNEGTGLIHTTPVAMVYETGKYSMYTSDAPRLEGVALATTAPGVDQLGNIIEKDRHNIGSIIHAGPAFAHLNIIEEEKKAS